MLTLVAALATAKAITDVTGADARIKWPNDIVIDGRKICGILTEMSAQFDYINHIVIGIGVNVHNEQFPEEIRGTAGSLLLACGRRFHRAELIARFLERFEESYAVFLQTEDLEGLMKEYNALLVNANQQVRVLDPKEPFEGKAIGITKKGELIVDTWESRKLVSSGEVSVRGIYGYV
jgi:BirA family biotin operon repressor/biotin-[acetyl-CoA-carboxylase] ligase